MCIVLKKKTQRSGVVEARYHPSRAEYGVNNNILGSPMIIIL